MKRNLPPYVSALLCLVALCCASSVYAASAVAGPAVPSAAAVVDERLGDVVPADIRFRGETGAELAFGSVVDRPTILVPAYFSCTNVCTDTAANLARIINGLKITPGVDFTIITVSFDENDTPERALRKRNDYIKASGREFPAKGWRFLTGDKRNIDRFTEAIGYRFSRQGSPEEKGAGFRHPAALVVLSPKRRITRYLYGGRYLPFDVRMAVAEAATGQPGVSVPRALLFCYSYDPSRGAYSLNFLKVAGLAVLSGAGVFLVFLAASSRKKRGRGERDEP